MFNCCKTFPISQRESKLYEYVRQDNSYSRQLAIFTIKCMTEDEILKVARSGSIEVRSLVAFSMASPSFVLEELSRDPEWRVRRSVACNPATSSRILLSLLADPISFVREAITDSALSYEKV